MSSSDSTGSLTNDSDTEDTGEYRDNYIGYLPPIGVTQLTDSVPANISPQEFFNNYIKQRRPTIIRGLLTDSNWNASNWTNSYLKEKAGNAQLLVEDRQNPASNEYLLYGISAPKVKMLYRDFLEAVLCGNTRYYLTTQDFEQCDHDGIPKQVFTEPLQSLTGEFPCHPDILGNLVPHQISVWQGVAGCDQHSSSSGLHHDFHDNLYVLVRGRKRFRLFPPSAAPFLRLQGKPKVIHANGLIVYPVGGECTVRSDGAPLVAVARQRRDDAERDLVDAELRLDATRDTRGSDCELKELQQTIADCEQRMDAALDDLLRYDASDDDDEPAVKQTKLTEPVLPDHFCHVTLVAGDVIDSKLLFAELSTPDRNNVGCLIAELNEGDMLYLPASWFHEVTSYDSSETDSDNNGHLAVNYWTHPPDNDSFQQPYLDQFWSRRWQKIASPDS